MEIKNAKYVISNADVHKCPDTDVPEYAFIGRSNVGKSSLINMLTRTRLAKTSQTPGKTLLINHFSINNGSWYIVDLPGYGYAARGKDQRVQFRRMIDSYILHRRQMALLFVLIDIRHKPQKIDLEFLEWLGENEVPFAIVFTKADKLGRLAAEKSVKDYCAVLSEQWEELPPVFVTSSEKPRGREDLLEYIGSINRRIADDSYADDNTDDNTDNNTDNNTIDDSTAPAAGNSPDKASDTAPEAPADKAEANEKQTESDDNLPES